MNYSRFDLRHKETLTLFLQEYFELFFPDLGEKMQFDTVRFLDKELIALFEKPDKKQGQKDQNRITDSLILIQIIIDGKKEQILILWEHQSTKQKYFEKRVFHIFCGIYFKFQRKVFPIAMFTDMAKWRKPVKSKYSLSLLDYPIADFTCHLIKLKNYRAEEFEKKINENPLAAAYLPLTDYPKEERPEIKAKALNRIASVPEGTKRAVLVSLVEHSIRLTPDEETLFQDMVKNNPMYKEVKMLQSVEEAYEEIWMDRGMEKGIEKGIEIGKEKGIEIGKEKGIKKGIEKTAVKMLRAGWLKKEQIVELTGLDPARVDELEKTLDRI